MPVDTVETMAGASTLHYRVKRNPLYDGPVRPLGTGPTYDPDVTNSEPSACSRSVDPQSTSASWGSGCTSVSATTSSQHELESWETVIPPISDQEAWTEAVEQSWSTVTSPTQTSKNLRMSNWLKRPTYN